MTAIRDWQLEHLDLTKIPKWTEEPEDEISNGLYSNGLHGGNAIATVTNDAASLLRRASRELAAAATVLEAAPAGQHYDASARLDTTVLRDDLDAAMRMATRKITLARAGMRDAGSRVAWLRRLLDHGPDVFRSRDQLPIERLIQESDRIVDEIDSRKESTDV